MYTQTVGESPDFGAHIIPFDTEFDTVYSWRVRARVGNELGPLSNWAEFLSQTRPSGTTPDLPPPAVPRPAPRPCRRWGRARPESRGRMTRPSCAGLRRLPGLRSRNSCQEHGGSWEFMDRTIDALRAKDGRYGYNCKRGNCNDPSVDVASYFWGNHTEFEGSSQVYIFDMIGGHCGPTPSVTWGDVTDITNSSGTIGRTTYPRPGRNVTPTTCGTAGQ